MSSPVVAQSTTAEPLSGEDKAVASVNGYEIKTSEVRMAFDDVISQLPNMPAKLRFPFVVEFLIERHLLAQVAAKDGIGESEDYKRRLAAYQAKALRDSYLAQKIAPNFRYVNLENLDERDFATNDPRGFLTRYGAETIIDERLLTAYKRIRNNVRNGLAVVSIARDACGGCFNKIPPQRQLDIRQRKKVIVCEHCGRILVDPAILD